MHQIQIIFFLKIFRVRIIQLTSYNSNCHSLWVPKNESFATFFSSLKLNELKNFNIMTAIFSLHYAPETFGGRAPPGPAGEFTKLPRPPICFKGAASRPEGQGKRENGRRNEGEERGREEREGRGHQPCP
jgi:hypothetical protein